MAQQSEQAAHAAKRLVWLGAFLCALCCTLPIVGIAAGSSVLAAAGLYLDRAGLAALAGAAALFMVWLYRRRRAPSCGMDCGCASGGRPHACR